MSRRGRRENNLNRVTIGSVRYQRPRGTEDVTPKDALIWRLAETTFADLADAYGYDQIRTPTFESTELFVRSSGESSEVVGKQMYTFLDKGGRSMTLKTEGTAPVLRACIENGLVGDGQTLRLWYNTPFFRHERPQKGRLREAHQFGVELIGSASPLADVEVMELTMRFYHLMGLDELVLSLNCIGKADDRARFAEALTTTAPVAAWLADQDEEARARALANPLRLLDSKDPSAQEAVADAPSILEFIGDDSRTRFDAIQNELSRLEIHYRVRPEIVRGLDYYTDTVFEIESEHLGAQSSLCGGGRYDDLFEALGGRPTPAVGVGIGIERLLIALNATGLKTPEPGLNSFVIATEESCQEAVRDIVRECRIYGIRCAYDFDFRSLKSQLRQADKLGALAAVIVGPDELAADQVTVRHMQTGDESRVSMDELLTKLIELEIED